ncbi:MAG: hypothetical protein KatS3mg088_282 [Patescibacteria group bacterium]|nr:MAG: hypothetical protein KatS3mg088_282 [Patescibacteria group bacterium]
MSFVFLGGIFLKKGGLTLRIEQGRLLSKNDLCQIRDWGENVFASACLKKTHLKVRYQVPINGKTNSVIDFEVTNIKAGKSKLVEVTITPRGKISSTERKLRQIANLKINGKPFVVLTIENLRNIARHL